MARGKKMSKSIDGDVLTITMGEHVLVYNVNELNNEIKSHLVMHGLSQKLGDSVASCDTVDECLNAIQRTWATLKKGEWSSRQPAGEKITKKSLLDKFEALSANEQQALLPLMQKLGLIKA